MNDKEKVIYEMKLAELQFRLAVTVRIAISQEWQSLLVPTQWVHGKHTVSYEEIVLTQEQADIASDYLKRTATYLMSITIRNALIKSYEDPKSHEDNNIVAAYQISRLIRNAFTHSPVRPVWSIDADCKNKMYNIENIITLNTSNLNGIPFDWRHYGGLLALFQLSKFVRINLLGDTDTGKNRNIPKPEKIIIQQGNLVLEMIDKLPDDARLNDL